MEYKTIFKTDVMKEMNDAYATYYFPEFQTMAMMIVENEKNVEFQGFQVTIEQDSTLGEILSYTIDYKRADSLLPFIKLTGIQNAATKEPFTISLEYLTANNIPKEKYMLFEGGNYFFN